MQKFILLLAFLGFAAVGAGQTTTIDFETAGDGYTPSATEGSGDTDVFNRSNPDIGGNNTYIWAAEDLILTDPTITLDEIDISSASSFSFSIDFLTPNSNDWDSTDELLITYSVDDGSSQNLMWVQNTGETNNAPAALDLDFNGDGDIGQELPALVDDYSAGVGNTFEPFYTSDIVLNNASTLDITLQFKNLIYNDEGIYIDNIKIYKDPPSITNITQNPSANTNITSSESVSVSADATDESSVSDIELNWGTSSGNLNTTINMSNTSGNTYETDSDIPTQSDGTTVYYVIKATDDDAGVNLSEEKDYHVQDPVSTPYNEDFTDQNGKGAIGGDAVTYDLEGVDWTLNINESGLTASTDWFKVEEEKFSARDIDEEQIWYSPYIDISGMNAIEISVDVSSVLNELEAGDYIETGYEIDDGSFTTIDKHEGELAETITDNITITNLNNDILRMVIKVLNNVGGEYYYFDNISAYTVNSFNSTSGNWNTATNWNNETVPIASENVVIPSDGAVTIASSKASGTCNDLLIQSDASGTGSLIVEGSLNVTGNATVQQYIEGWVPSGSDGWHLLSSPIGTFTIDGSDFDPGSNDDLYRWEESTNIWKNHKAGDPTEVSPGMGYLVAYENNSTKEFTGTLNTGDQTVTNLSYNASEGNGWNLVGNPFSSAIKWNDDSWNLPGSVQAEAKIRDESAGNYIGITSGATIPINQGFFVQITSDNVNITIPSGAQFHGNTAFYKKEKELEGFFKLKVKAEANTFYDIQTIRLHEASDESYDRYDSEKFYGNENAPQIYSIDENLGNLSTHSVHPSSIDDSRIFPLGFEAVDGEYTLLLSLNTLGEEYSAVLEDTKADKMIDFSEQETYTFSALEGDDVERFRLHLEKSAIGIPEDSELQNTNIYANNHNIYIQTSENLTDGTVFVYNTLGQLVVQKDLNNDYCVIGMEGKGAYIVKIRSEEGIATEKVIIQ
ncbi:MAG: T9SS type A sorting domain-containing protein [Bacteroidales bacterium]|nr:T9SS type A sorting domain-containing protein [Bacteroidales bacterium]